MNSDPGIQPVRAVRKEISRQFDNDPARMVRYYMEFQKRFGARLKPGPEEGISPDEAVLPQPQRRRVE